MRGPPISPFQKPNGERPSPPPYTLSPAAYRQAASASSKKQDDHVSIPTHRSNEGGMPGPIRRLGSTRGSGNLNIPPTAAWSSRWQLLLFLFIGGALWWSGMQAIQRAWDPGDFSTPFWQPFSPRRSHGRPPVLDNRYDQRLMLDLASQTNVSAYQSGHALGVCIMTADFWGSPTAGGTATAYHLLAHVLASDPKLNVTMLGVTRKKEDCQAGIKLNAALAGNINFTCLEDHHFIPEVNLFPRVYDTDILLLKLMTVFNSGLRLAIEAHGGHFWSTQGQVQRPLDIMSLRIDHGERMTLGLASALISPTHYMTAFLAQRGWTLPHESIVIPNIIPAVEPSDTRTIGGAKRVWRLAFFSRLEERKGLKMFVEAVNRLTAGGRLPTANFEVLFVGAEAMIDMRPSREWISEKTASWSFPVHMNVNVKRDEALDILSGDGILLVLCSMIDNMPYVVAEAAAKGIPFLVFDVGGVLEMIDEQINRDSVILQLTTEALYKRMHGVLKHGSLKLAKLSEKVTTGKEQWLDWHHELAANRISTLQQEDMELAGLAAGHRLGNLIIKKIKLGSSSLEVWSDVCLPRTSRDAVLLLLPENYEIISPEAMSGMLPELLQMSLLRGNGIGAYAFGVEHEGKYVSFPGSPTWMLYTSSGSECNEDIPIVVRKQIFCQSYFAEARIFRQYHSWTLSMLLAQSGWRTHTYPEVLFRVTSYLMEGHSCLPDKPPMDRQLDFNSVSNLYSDAEQVMVGVHLAPFPKPISSITDDFPTEQNHKGWQIGYGVPNSPRLQELSFWPSPGGEGKDGKWSCRPDSSMPALSHSLAHPCSGGGTACCGYPTTPIITRFNSFFTSEHAVLIAAYEVWPICGDGLDIEISLSSNSASGRFKHVFMRQGFESDKVDTPQRQRVEFRFSLHVGDYIDVTVWPRGTHDCDGVYIVDIQIWEQDGMAKQKQLEDPQQDEDSSKLKEAAVGAVTEGNADSFAAASRGEKASVQNSLKAGSGAMEAATHQQGETDSHSELPKNLPLRKRRRLLARLLGGEGLEWQGVDNAGWEDTTEDDSQVYADYQIENGDSDSWNSESDLVPRSIDQQGLENVLSYVTKEIQVPQGVWGSAGNASQLHEMWWRSLQTLERNI